jgi:hypothetical protein
MNTALNRTTIAYLTNKSGGALTYGAVVVLDNSNANGFTTTTTAGLSTRGLGVILDVAGIANNATGAVAIGGWCPQVNLNTAATVGQFLKTHTVAGQATPHSSPQAEGDFAVALSASATPAAMLFGGPNPPIGSGTVTNTGTLTAGKVILGNGGVDVAPLAMGTAGQVLTVNAGATAAEWAAASGGGGLLAITKYAPATNTIFSTTSTSLADLDTTNLSITFTVPSSGKVIVRLSAYADNSSSAQQYFWALRTTAPALVSGASVGPNRDTNGQTQTGDIYITGLTPAASVTYRWAHGITGGATGRVIAGPGVTSSTVSTSDMFQPAIMQVWTA